MNKPNWSRMLKSLRESVSKHSPEILTGIGIAGMITTTVLAVRATPKALILIADKEEENPDEPLNAMDKVKATWPCYIPSALTGALSVACLIGATSVNVRRNAALATAYSLSESALKEYQEKVIETIGEKKEQGIRDSIAKDKIKADPVANHEVIITGKGATLCYDSVSGRYFQSDIEKLRKAENELNRVMLSEMYVSLNDFYCEIGLEPTRVGDDIGWNIDKGYIHLDFSAQLTEDGEPCLVLDYQLAPQYNYQNIH